MDLPYISPSINRFIWISRPVIRMTSLAMPGKKETFAYVGDGKIPKREMIKSTHR
jgi:hypothetical protein